MEVKFIRTLLFVGFVCILNGTTPSQAIDDFEEQAQKVAQLRAHQFLEAR